MQEVIRKRVWEAKRKSLNSVKLVTIPSSSDIQPGDFVLITKAD